MQKPGPQLYLAVRTEFVARGTSLHAWCTEHGVAQANARLALWGSWNGPKAKELRARILKATDLEQPAVEARRRNVA